MFRSLFLFFSCLSTLSAQELSPIWQIISTSNDTINGKIVEFSTANSLLVLENSSLTKPISIPTGKINQITRLNKAIKSEGSHIILTNGDGIFGEILNFSPKSTEIKTSFGETISLPSESICEIRSNSTTLTPVNLSSKNIKVCAGSGVQIRGNTWTSKNYSLTKITLPKSNFIRWQSNIVIPNSQLFFMLGSENSIKETEFKKFNDHIESTQNAFAIWETRGRAYYNFTASEIYKISVSPYQFSGGFNKNEAGISSFEWNASINLRDSKSAPFQLDYNANTRKLTVIVDGVTKQIDLPAVNFTETPSFYILAPNHTNFRLSDIRISTSEQKYLLPSKENLQKNQIILKDQTQQMTGNITDLSKGKWSIKTSYGELKIPREKIERIQLHPLKEEKNDKNSEKIFLIDGSELSGKISEISAKTLTFSHHILSSIAILIPLENIWSISMPKPSSNKLNEKSQQ